MRCFMHALHKKRPFSSAFVRLDAPYEWILSFKERRAKLFSVLCVSRLDDALNLHFIDACVQPRALVVDILDAYAEVGEQSNKARNAPRAVRNRRNKAHEAIVSCETSIQDAPENCRIDVAAAKRHDHILPF